MWVLLKRKFFIFYIKSGRSVIQHITPIATPFIITIPIFLPGLNLMSISAANPAIVFTELLATDLNVSVIDKSL